MKRFACALLASTALCLSGSAIADDSSATLGMGGVQLQQSTDIRMTKEDLRISPKAVHVRFEFLNESGKDIETMMAFVLPDLDTSEFTESALGTTTNDPINFVGLSVTADGVKVPFQVEQRAMYKGQDVTSIVKSVGLPVNVVVDRGWDRLTKLTAAQKKLLESHDLTDNESGEDEHPHWTVQTRFYWTQKFPAGKTVVLDQNYQPVTGQAFFDKNEYADDLKGTGFYQKPYCFDAPTVASLGKQLDIAAKQKRDDGGMLYAMTTDYVLKTGNNWKGPIGDFHMTLVKEHPDDVLSLCWDGDLKKTGPLTFESTRQNFAPKQDVHMAVIEQRPPG